jgi:hypothetical protein
LLAQLRLEGQTTFRKLQAYLFVIAPPAIRDNIALAENARSAQEQILPTAVNGDLISPHQLMENLHINQFRCDLGELGQLP